eukprot:SAG25_NODE_375_length_8919_cov_7.676644_8_plen_111_part_00
MADFQTILSTLNNTQTITTVYADKICQMEELGPIAQTSLIQAINTAIRDLKAKQSAAKFVAENTKHVLQYKLPGLIVGYVRDGFGGRKKKMDNLSNFLQKSGHTACFDLS